MELTSTFMTLLEGFLPVFTAPSFATFRLLMSGWILSVRHRYVTDLIISSDSVGNGHFSDYHRFFSQASWAIDELWKLLAELIIKTFLGNDAVIMLAADDTLCRKRGLTLFGAGMHHDPLISSRAMKLVSWGHDWVILSIVIANCRWAPTKVFALPICVRLYRNRQGLTKGQKDQKKKSRQSRTSQRKQKQKKAKTAPAKVCKNKNTPLSTHQTRPELLSEMLALVAAWFPNRRFHIVVDSLYSGKSVLSHLPENVDLTGPVHPRGTLYAPAPKRTEKRPGPARKKGERLSSRDEWAANKTRWRRITFDQYGLHGTFAVKTRRGLYYTAGKDRLLNFVLTQDTAGKRPTQIFYTTDLKLSAQETLSKFSYRWATEVMHFDAKQHLGFEDPANRTPKAVQRTAPMALFLYSLTIVWYAKEGRRHVRFPKRPWYPRKSEPSFGDMLTTLRRLTWEDKLSTVRDKGTPHDNPIELLTFLGTLAG
jgi:hypothetical protein